MITLFKRLMRCCSILLVFTNIFVTIDNNTKSVCVSANDENTYFEEINNNESGSIGSGDNGRYRGTGDSLPFEVDYSDLNMLETVKKGDIFFDSQGSVLAGRNYYHVAIVEGIFYDEGRGQDYIRVIESYSDSNPSANGVTRGILCPERFNYGTSALLRVKNATEAQINGAVSFAINQLGDGYNLSDAMGAPFGTGKKHTDSDSKNSWYCSELVWAAYHEQGIELDIDDNDNGGSFVFPTEIRDSENTFAYRIHEAEVMCNQLNYARHSFSLGEGRYYTENHHFIFVNNSFNKCFHCGYIQQNHASISFRAYDRYKEKSFYLNGIESFLIYFTPYISGYYVLQTAGNLDTFIDIANTTFYSLAGGYENNSYLRAYLASGNTYQIAINTIEENSSGYSKIIITKSSGIIKSGYSSINTLSAIKTYTSQFSVSGAPNYSEMLLVVFKPHAEGNYVITSFSDDLDTFLYVVDLSNSDELVEDEDYNDDNINDMDTTDSLVYKTFHTNKTYLIVFGSYNPQYHNGVDTLSVRAR